MNLTIGETFRLTKQLVTIEECMIDQENIKYYIVKNAEGNTLMLKLFKKPFKSHQFEKELQGYKTVGLHGKLLHYYDNIEESDYYAILLEYTARFTVCCSWGLWCGKIWNSFQNL